METRMLYGPKEAGQLLGGLHANDVLRLVRQGKLEAKLQIVRGSGQKPRKVIPAAALQRYVESLPPAPIEREPAPGAATAAMPADPEPMEERRGRRRGSGRMPSSLAAELAAVEQYR